MKRVACQLELIVLLHTATQPFRYFEYTRNMIVRICCHFAVPGGPCTNNPPYGVPADAAW
jgi:hypothetical protein